MTICWECPKCFMRFSQIDFAVFPAACNPFFKPIFFGFGMCGFLLPISIPVGVERPSSCGPSKVGAPTSSRVRGYTHAKMKFFIGSYTKRPSAELPPCGPTLPRPGLEGHHGGWSVTKHHRGDFLLRQIFSVLSPRDLPGSRSKYGIFEPRKLRHFFFTTLFSSVCVRAPNEVVRNAPTSLGARARSA